MKTLSGIILFFLATTGVFSQEYRAPMNANKIRLILHNTEISIEGHDSNELVINALGYKAPPERADGLRPLYSGGTDNSGIGLSINEENGQLTVLKVGRNDVDYDFNIPKNATVVIEEVNYAGGDIDMKNLAGEIEVKTTNSDVKMEDVSGPIVANSVSGDIDVVFTTVNQQKPTSITIVSGDVDITLPGQTPANLKLGSVSGEVYTNFDIQMEGNENEKDMIRMSIGRPIEGTINNGGVDMRVKTVSGNIYLRKSE